MRAVPMCADLRSSDGGCLRSQYQFVYIALRRAEFAIDWESARDVGGVATHFTACIDQQQVAVIEQRVVTDIVQGAGIRAARDDAGIGWIACAVLAELVQKFGFHLVFVEAGAGIAHGAQMCCA